ncbi:hypothetical protein Zmor_012821 [Zophobas morio]|uniref:Uncharacterized protein n=1 Tax=Zophobas morio TaxID=2755281 RepID=A0AA38I9Q4_9CUCU|nr:hypothetical protein Zmor_012821 [Zophobas morio]
MTAVPLAKLLGTLLILLDGAKMCVTIFARFFWVFLCPELAHVVACRLTTHTVMVKYATMACAMPIKFTSRTNGNCASFLSMAASGQETVRPNCVRNF